MALPDPDRVLRRAMRGWKPPERLSLSEWADRDFVLSAESAAEPGRWRTIPYQRGWMDAISDPAVSEVTLKKSARIGYTLSITAAIGYFIEHDPASILVVQPTVDDGKNFSKESIAPALRDVPVLAAIRFREMEDKGPKDSSNTLVHKAFPGGVLSIIGANSGTGFRRVSRRVVFLDEVDAYPPSAGSEGDPVELAKKRARSFWNRKIIAGSTPLTEGSSRISELYDAGDRRRYYVPCPTCGHMDFLTFREQTGEDARGHWMAWPEGRPEEAHFVCRGCGCEIEHKHKREMVEGGEWRAERPFAGHASFAIWAAYSYSPNDTWGQLAAEFVAANKGGPEKLKTYVNTVLGETWIEKGDAPDWSRIYDRRETYEIATVPAPVLFLTAGVDVQKDRLVYEVQGWGEDRQSWSIDAGVLPGDTAGDVVWAELDGLLARTYPGPNGGALPIRMMGVDSGFNTQAVYDWARRHVGRVIACKGIASGKTLLGQPTAVDVTYRGKRITHGCKVWPIGVDIAKQEFYGWLRLEKPRDGQPFPPGWCHFPGYGDDYFRGITAEHLVTHVMRTGRVRMEWQIVPGRENHPLDCRIYGRAAAALLGLDRYAAAAARRARPAAPPPAPVPAASAAPPVTESVPPPSPGVGFLHGGRPRNPWLR